jgi:TolA-binding protein
MKAAAILLALVLSSCAHGAEQERPAVEPAAPPPPASAVEPPKPPSSRSAPAPAHPAPPTATPDEIARARALVDRGVKLYREGQYAQAEDVLKQGITLYPFMADANLVLAKILLIRASATKDMTLYTNARLMLEMARALDPSSREVEQLLELVRQPTAD